jgi:NADH:ubiquinone oxidoreductase subunit E
MSTQKTDGKIGAVLVVGGGVGGIQASLDLVESGFKVYLVDRNPSIGGVMTQLDKTFPTNDCAMCTLGPRLVECGRHINIEKLTYSEVEAIEGGAGHFKVRIRKKARSVDESKCTGCGECVQNCLVRNRVYLEPGPSIQIELEEEDKTKIERIIQQSEPKMENLIPILQDINAEFNWLPQGALMLVARALEIPLGHVLRVASFYNIFSLKPRGKHIINVCLGTACHVRGAGRILGRFQEDLEIGPGETTSDRQFTLETVHCVGACALGPIVVCDGEYHGHMTNIKVDRLIKNLREKK